MDRRQLLNDLEEGVRIALDGRQVGIWTAIPGIIESVDFDAMTCVVQPVIKATTIDQNGVTSSVNLPLLADVPLIFPACKGFMLTLPIAVNDEVLVIFASRCIDAWWQLGGIQKPMEFRMHDLSDGFAIPGPFSQPNVPMGPISTSSIQLRNADGSSYVEIDEDGNINMVGATVTINGKNFATHEHSLSIPSTPFTGDTGGVV